MPINSVSLAQTMRPGEIDAITQLNEVITVVNNLDLSGISQQLATISSQITTINSRLDAIDGNNGSIANLTTRVTTNETDITGIKATLYTPLNQNI